MNELELQERNRQYKEKLAYIEDLFRNDIVDPNIRYYIFNSTETKKCTRKVPDYVSYINNAMRLAFVFAYGCFRIDSVWVDRFGEPDSCCERAEKTGALRIINSLKKAYVQYPLTPDLIEFVLTDIQFDMMQGRDSELCEVFSPMCNFSDPSFSLSKYFKLIKDWLACPARFSMDANELADRFTLFLENMSFLSTYSLKEEDGEFYFLEKRAERRGNFDKKYSRIPANHLLFKDAEKYMGIYTLFSCDRKEEGEQKLALRYSSTDGYSSINVSVSGNPSSDDENHISALAEEYYSEITGSVWPSADAEEGQDTGVNFINQVHAINYKYIKNLALAVSDAISGNVGSKKVLLDAFRVHHPNIFIRENRSADILAEDADWDGITVMLLIEASPTKVLEVLFHKVPQTFYDIAKNLCKRIDNPDMPIYGCSESMLDKKVNAVIQFNLIDEASGYNRKKRNSTVGGKLFAKAAAMLIVSSLSSVMEEDSDEKLICVGNIHENIALLSKMTAEPVDETTEKRVSSILGETFRHLNCFYRGIVAYGEVKAIFDNESADCCLPRAKISSYQSQLKNAFMTAAKEEAKRLKVYDTTVTKDAIAIIDEFVKLCKKCSSSSILGENLGRSLYVTLGKYEIMNVNEFENRTAAFLEDAQGMKEMSSRSIEYFTGLALDVLKFLTLGTFDAPPMKGVPMSAIYPLAATYSRGNENYDGYKTATFTLNIDMDYDEINDKEDVNVLTEFFYAPGDVFYCLPNALRSNKRWWIDPLLVGFKEFNEIFTEEEQA